MTKRDRRFRGFTLVEMLIALVIGAILFGIAVPNFRDLILRNRMSSNANDLTFALARARTEAIKLSRPVVVCPTADADALEPECANTDQWAIGWMVFGETVDSNQEYDDGEPLLVVHQALKGDYSVAFNGPKPFVIFGAQGLPTGGTFGSFKMVDEKLGTDEEDIRTVCLSITGKARVVKGTACAT